MSYRVWGDRISTGDFVALSAFQVIKLNKNFVILAAKVSLIVYNSPVYDFIRGNLYTVVNGKPESLICTSDNIFKPADVCAVANGVKEIYFTFKSPYGVRFSGLDQIAFVLTASGYVGDANSHLAMQKAWPDPVYKLNFTPTLENLPVAPRRIALIGART